MTDEEILSIVLLVVLLLLLKCYNSKAHKSGFNPEYDLYPTKPLYGSGYESDYAYNGALVEDQQNAVMAAETLPLNRTGYDMYANIREMEMGNIKAEIKPYKKGNLVDRESVKSVDHKEGFGMDDRPFEPDGSLLHRNPWDDVDYMRPVYTLDM